MIKQSNSDITTFIAIIKRRYILISMMITTAVTIMIIRTEKNITPINAVTTITSNAITTTTNTTIATNIITTISITIYITITTMTTTTTITIISITITSIATPIPT